MTEPIASAHSTQSLLVVLELLELLLLALLSFDLLPESPEPELVDSRDFLSASAPFL